MTGDYQQTKTEIPRFGEQISQGSTTQDSQTDILERLETLSNQTGQLRVEVQDRSVKYNIQLRDLGDDSYKLTEPIFIIIEEYPGEDLLIASFSEVEVFGEGATEAEAILNLKWGILDLYQELIDLPPEEMGNLPKSWLSVLQQIIKKV
jgi:hypothetical protein